MEVEIQKNPSWLVPIWTLFAFGALSYIIMMMWAISQSHSCVGAECAGAGILQGLFIYFVSLPAMVVSGLIALTSFFLRRKKGKIIGNSHRALLLSFLIALIIFVLF